MKLYRIKNTATGHFYRHKYSQFRGGDWVDAKDATIWTKVGGVNGAIGAVKEKAKNPNTFIVETAAIDPEKIKWE